MVVLRSFAFILFIYALVAMEATVSKTFKVGDQKQRNGNKKKKKKRTKKSKGTVSKSEGTLKRHY